MVSNKEIIQRVQQRYSKGIQSDESRLSNRLVYSEIVSVRNVLIIQQINKGQKVSRATYQDLIGIHMEDAPIHEVSNIPAGTILLRSKHRIPNILTDKDRHLIEHVTTLDGMIHYDEASWSSLSHAKGRKYTSKKPQFILKPNRYLYITTKRRPEIVTLQALFENPLEAQLFPVYGDCETDENCISHLDRPFPMDGDKLSTLVEMVSESLIERFNKQPQDKTNNAEDDVI